jgi:hypothetical protein
LNLLPAGLACIIFCDELCMFWNHWKESQQFPLITYFGGNCTTCAFLCFLSTLKKPQLAFFDYLLGYVIRENASVE